MRAPSRGQSGLPAPRGRAPEALLCSGTRGPQGARPGARPRPLPPRRGLSTHRSLQGRGMTASAGSPCASGGRGGRLGPPPANMDDARASRSRGQGAHPGAGCARAARVALGPSPRAGLGDGPPESGEGRGGELPKLGRWGAQRLPDTGRHRPTSGP